MNCVHAKKMKAPGSRGACVGVQVTSVHRNTHRRGRNSIRHHLQRTGSRLDRGRYIEHRRDDRRSGSHSHGAVVVRLRIEDVPSAVVRDPDQRIVRRSFKLVAECSRLRQAIELRAGDFVGQAVCHGRRNRGDRRSPSGFVRSRRIVDFGSPDQDLTGRQHHEAAGSG